MAQPTESQMWSRSVGPAETRSVLLRQVRWQMPRQVRFHRAQRRRLSGPAHRAGYAWSSSYSLNWWGHRFRVDRWAPTAREAVLCENSSILNHSCLTRLLPCVRSAHDGFLLCHKIGLDQLSETIMPILGAMPRSKCDHHGGWHFLQWVWGGVGASVQGGSGGAGRAGQGPAPDEKSSPYVNAYLVLGLVLFSGDSAEKVAVKVTVSLNVFGG